MSKHTPGPWTAEPHAVYSGLDEVAAIHSIGYAPDERYANARLIAAAPDMAKMLNLWMCFVLHGSNSAYNEKEMLAATRALLAKAGQS